MKTTFLYLDYKKNSNAVIRKQAIKKKKKDQRFEQILQQGKEKDDK